MKKKIIWEREFVGVKLFFDNGEWVIVVHREFKNSLMCIVKKIWKVIYNWDSS
jgi:hypothetical protein